MVTDRHGPAATIGSSTSLRSVLARRMLAFVLVLLILGLGAAVLNPRPAREGGSNRVRTATSPSPRTAPPTGSTLGSAGGTAAPETLNGARFVAGSLDHPPLVKARRGELLNLAVSVPEPTALLVEGYGVTETADPKSPAHFSLLLYQRGRFAIRPTTGGGPVAELQVR